jgi:hypothetical protein
VVVHDDPDGRDELELLAAARDACGRAGIAGREQAVAYCLVVLRGKADPLRATAQGAAGRTYELDAGAEDYAERLRWWAETIAGNLRDWAPAYDAIHDELDLYEITTLRSLIRLRSADDVIDAIADKLAMVLSTGPRVEDMTIELAHELVHAGAEYVFQSPLSRWVATAVNRAAPWDTDPIGAREEALAGWTDVEREIEQREELHRNAYEQLVGRVARLADTRILLTEAIENIERLDRVAAGSRLASASDVTLFARLRAELAHVADELGREQRAFGGMLAYVVLAMRMAPGLQGVAILSLRVASLERAVVDHIAGRMRTLLSEEQQPAPKLIQQTRDATPPLSRHRLKALEILRDAPQTRAAELRPVGRLLDALPATVANVAAIGPALPKPISESNVATSRGHAVRELGAVDVWFERAFRRYAMGRA